MLFAKGETMTDVPTPDTMEIKFPISKRYRRLKVVNYSNRTYKVMTDIDRTNTLVVYVFPAEMDEKTIGNDTEATK